MDYFPWQCLTMFDYRRVPDDSIDARWCRPRLRESTCCPGNWRNVRSLDKGRGNQSGMWPTCGLLSKKMIRANVIEKDESSKCKDNIGELMHIIFKVYSWLMLIVNTMRCEMVPKKILWASRQIRMEIITRICRSNGWFQWSLPSGNDRGNSLLHFYDLKLPYE